MKKGMLLTSIVLCLVVFIPKEGISREDSLELQSIAEMIARQRGCDLCHQPTRRTDIEPTRTAIEHLGDIPGVVNANEAARLRLIVTGGPVTGVDPPPTAPACGFIAVIEGGTLADTSGLRRLSHTAVGHSEPRPFSGGRCAFEFTVRADPQTDEIRVFAAGNSVNGDRSTGGDLPALLENAPFRLAVNRTQPFIVASPSVLNFSTMSGFDPDPLQLSIHNSGAGQLNYVIEANPPEWLSVQPADGGNGTAHIVTASPVAARLAPGNYRGTLRIIDANALNAPYQVDVLLAVQAFELGSRILTPDDLARFDRYGSAVAFALGVMESDAVTPIDVLVGAPPSNRSDSPAGAVYVFRKPFPYEVDHWELYQKIEPPHFDKGFGSHIATTFRNSFSQPDGFMVVRGSRGVYFYHREGPGDTDRGNWVLDNFYPVECAVTCTVSMAGGFAAVSTTGLGGRVEIFEREASSTNWVLATKINPPDDSVHFFGVAHTFTKGLKSRRRDPNHNRRLAS